MEEQRQTVANSTTGMMGFQQNFMNRILNGGEAPKVKVPVSVGINPEATMGPPSLKIPQKNSSVAKQGSNDDNRAELTKEFFRPKHNEKRTQRSRSRSPQNQNKSDKLPSYAPSRQQKKLSHSRSPSAENQRRSPEEPAPENATISKAEKLRLLKLKYQQRKQQ